MSRRRKILLATAVVLGMLFIIPVLRHFQLKRAVEQYKAELKAKGEPMELAQVLPPSVPPERNSAPLFTNAVARFNTNWNVLGSNPPPTMRMIAPGKAMIGWQQLSIRDGRASNSWAEIETALAQDNEALVMLRQITNGVVFDFKLDLSRGLEKVPLPQLVLAKRAAQRLLAGAMNDLHRGDAAAAADSIQAALAVVQGMSHDQIIISELVRMAITQMTYAGNWELLQSTNVTDSQLAAMQFDWSGLEFIHAAERALELERASVQISLAEWRQSDAALRRYADVWGNMEPQIQTPAPRRKIIWNKLKINANIYLWRHWWSYPDELRYLKGMQVLLDTTRQARTNDSLLAISLVQEKQIEQVCVASGENRPFWFSDPSEADYHLLISSSVMGLGKVFSKVIKVEAAKQMAITAIALKRFQLKHGTFPEKLAELTPEFLASVPLDPVDGLPLRYRLNADGTFMLYSIGENGKDDGGNPSPTDDAKSKSLQWQNSNALDWVWPQPATAEQIQKYYEEQAKKFN